MRENCSFTASLCGDVLEVCLTGEIDHHSAVFVRGKMDERILADRPRKTVLDLSGIEFMDSSGLGLIMGRLALMERLGGELTVRHPNERLRRIFELAGLERKVRIERTEEEKEQET